MLEKRQTAKTDCGAGSIPVVLSAILNNNSNNDNNSNKKCAIIIVVNRWRSRQ